MLPRKYILAALNQWLFIIATLLLLSDFLAAQTVENFPPPDERQVIQAIPASEPIVVDGQLDETDWAIAPTTSEFFRMEPRQGGTYNYMTYVKVLFDEKNIYFGVFAKDSLGKKGIRVQDLRRDFAWGENDVFGIQLDPQNLKQYCVSFQATPFGSQRDLQNFNDDNTDNEWNALWKVRTTRTDSGYYAEFAIPFKSIRYDLDTVKDPTSWGITFNRLARRDYEQTVYPAIPQSLSPYRMTYAAELKGLVLPKPSTNIRIEPYALYQYDRTSEGGVESTQHRPKAGGDFKWAITPKAVLDLTINTDFAQADVDRAVNNLERFNIFFPERRQFFLENSGIWAGANNQSVVPFFSRRIGLQGNFNAEPAPIHAGSRYTFRDEKQTLAGLYVHQAETESSPAASFAVARYLRNYGKENNVGLMLTHRWDEASDSLGIGNSHNTTFTVDGLVRPKDEWTISYMLTGARDDANDTLGIAGRIFTGYSSNKLYAGWLTNIVSPEYNPDMGFVFQQNVIHHSPGGYFIWRPKNIPWIRRWDPGAFVNYYHDAANPRNFQQANVYLFPLYVIFTNGSFLQYALFPTWQNINFNFAPLGISIAPENYFYTRHQINFNTDQSAKLSGSGSVNWGAFYNGKRTTLKGGLRFAPSVHAALDLDYEFNDLQELGIRAENLQTHLASVGARFAPNPRLQLSVFYQYNSFDDRGRWNARASWEYRPLSFLYLVFNDTRIDSFTNPFRQQQLVSKITYIKQF